MDQDILLTIINDPDIEESREIGLIFEISVYNIYILTEFIATFKIYKRFSTLLWHMRESG